MKFGGTNEHFEYNCKRSQKCHLAFNIIIRKLDGTVVFTSICEGLFFFSLFGPFFIRRNTSLHADNKQHIPTDCLTTSELQFTSTRNSPVSKIVKRSVGTTQQWHSEVTSISLAALLQQLCCWWQWMNRWVLQVRYAERITKNMYDLGIYHTPESSWSRKCVLCVRNVKRRHNLYS